MGRKQPSRDAGAGWPWGLGPGASAWKQAQPWEQLSGGTGFKRVPELQVTCATLKEALVVCP